jgi:hypothetical protein
MQDDVHLGQPVLGELARAPAPVPLSSPGKSCSTICVFPGQQAPTGSRVASPSADDGEMGAASRSRGRLADINGG